MSLRRRHAARLILFGVCLLFVCHWLLALQIPLGRSRAKVVEQDWKQLLALLLAEGPALAFRRDGVDGDVVVRGGWPVVVDYELERPGFLLLTIAVEKGENRSYRVPADGTAPAGVRRDEVLHLSKDLGDAIQAGNLSLRAYEGMGGDRPVPFDLYGLGAGERAVGSMTIADVMFSPAEIAVKHDQKAEYGGGPACG
jgi:HAMP domain-containing protein